MTTDFVPNSISGKADWYSNYRTKILVAAKQLQLPEEEVSTTIKMCDIALSTIEEVNEARRRVKSAVKHRNEVIKTTEAYIRNQIKKIKSADAYDQRLGEAMEIIGQDIEFNAGSYQPEVEVAQVSNGVKLEFTKSHTDGVNVYRRFEGEDRWTYLARDTRSPYIDTEKIDHHATLEYLVWAVIDDEEIGKESKIVRITV